MKKIVVLISSVTLLLVLSVNLYAVSSSIGSSMNDSIHVWSSPELFEITKTLVSKYVETNPELKMDAKLFPKSGSSTILSTSGNIGFVSKNYDPTLNNASFWRMVVGRDIVVPVINSKNPYKDKLYNSGISINEFLNVFSNPINQKWGNLIDNDESTPISCYCGGDESINTYLADFLQTDLNTINAKKSEGIEAMLKEIQNDIYALGFCRLIDIIDYENQKIKDGFMLVPIDINGNNKVDYVEDIYTNINYFTRGIWIGKYPKALYSSIYSIASIQPTDKNELAFLEWIITEGQQYLYVNGYSELTFSERETKVQGLYANLEPIVNIQNKSTPLITKSFLLVLILAGVFILILVFRSLKSRNKNIEVGRLSMKSIFGEKTVQAPGGLFFDKSHTWIFMEKDGDVRIGVDDFLQHVIGPITRVKMKNPGDIIKKGEPFLSLIQYGKKLEIQSPISGTIKEHNIRLESASSLINNSPYLSGWVYVMESVNWLNEIKYFFMGETYKNWIKNEFLRLKDFFSTIHKLEENSHLRPIMQDGGELNSSLMEELGPEVWEEFQTRFINLSK